jgi:hypothetical protein
MDTSLHIQKSLRSYCHKGCVNSPLSPILRPVPIPPHRNVSLADWYAVCDVPIPFNRVIGETAVFVPSSGEKTAEP